MKQWSVGLFGILVALAISGCGKTAFSSVGDSEKASQAAAPTLEEAAVDPELTEKPHYNCGDPLKQDHKVLVCHVPPGNPDNRHTICIGKPALKAHLRLHVAHGDPDVRDTLGACPGDDGAEEPVEDPADPTDDDVL